MALNSGVFYQTYHGHSVEHLRVLKDGLRKAGIGRFAYLAGDSSLDNKHWFFDPMREKASQIRGQASFVDDALNGYEKVLSPPRMVKDVSYW
eukprot:CAMPEP_0172677580 /NCGR_PEP_ID=MMETSP1074-20121228/14773_1 /TAXON_ID=2916 /ORGANISM="Ceratium fusus, Strain PA161109" /LENGTH=91 /DNA_ID=CAMNT_0013495441 /DNA_START=1 /DNA_END=273 /DNA_ORIENTATION=-